MLREIVGEYGFLFRDRQELVLKDKETVELIARQRIDEHQKAEETRLEAERARIRREEAARLQAEQDERERKAAAGALKKQAVELAGDLVEVARAVDASQVPDEVEGKTRTRVEVVNKLELLKAVINGEVPDDVLIVDIDLLAHLCETRGCTFPGVIWA